MDLVFAPFKNPRVLNYTPGDTNWAKLTGFPPGSTDVGRFLVTSVASISAGGSGSMFWIQMNKGAVAPSDNTHAWPVHGSGQVLELGGGVNDLWIKLTAAGDTVVIMYES